MRAQHEHFRLMFLNSSLPCGRLNVYRNDVGGKNFLFALLLLLCSSLMIVVIVVRTISSNQMSNLFALKGEKKKFFFSLKQKCELFH